MTVLGPEERKPRPEFPRPVVVISRCLELEPVRYNGQVIPYDLVRELEPFVQFVPICPELEIGLGVPRDPIRIVDVRGEARLLQPSTDLDLTDAMRSFSDRFLGSLDRVDGFILKNRSPSCGIKDVKVYPKDGSSGPVAKQAGVFGAAVVERYPGLAIEDEGRLRNYRIREHFLTRLFALARLREVLDTGRMGRLVQFHTSHKYLLMAYHQGRLRELGRIVANGSGRPFDEVAAGYREGFAQALMRSPRYTSVINVLQHAVGHLSERLNRDEKAFFGAVLEDYRAGRIPVSAAIMPVRTWAVRFQVGYLLQQSFFRPYPEALMSVTDSGKGRLD